MSEIQLRRLSSCMGMIAPKPLTDYIEVHKVRITPSVLSFRGAYDGKSFDEKFTIINLGKYPALIRIFPTTSKAFKMNPLPKGQIICSGMSIVRHVTYTCKSINIPQAYIYIYVNESPILYPLEVLTAKALVRITPRTLYFGEIDVGASSQPLSLSLINIGEKITKFSIDLGRNDLEIIVDPMMGTIQPGHTEEVRVELLGTRVGDFVKEFWVKTEPLQRVWLTGIFIEPQLKLEHPLNEFDLIVIDFPKTYYNAQNKRIMIITNDSSTNSMFCTVAEYNKNEDVSLDRAKDLNENMNFFQINPKEGRLLRDHKAVVTVTFAPYKVTTFTKKYCIIFVKIKKINYRDGFVKGKELNIKTFSNASKFESYQIADFKHTETMEELKWEGASSYLRICLYGEIEETKVKVTPDTIDRSDLHVEEEYKLTFNIKNESQNLPIMFKYEKVSGFNMDPPQATLKQSSSKDVLLILKPHTMGKYNIKINLALYYKNREGNSFRVGTAHLRVDYSAITVRKSSTKLKPKFHMGITSPFISGVGERVHNVRYNNANASLVPVMAFANESHMKKCLNQENSDLIAFPNDRPKGNYPWRNDIPCTTIFAKLPRYNVPIDYEYAYTPSKLIVKNEHEQKYLDYIRNELKPSRKNESSVDNVYPTNDSKVLLTKEKIPGCLNVFSFKETWPKFISLTPEELMAVEITPRHVVLGKLAPYVMCSEFFEIRNNNVFPIIINIIALSNCLVVKGKRRQKIGAKNSAKVFFECYSHGLGKFYVPVFITINDSHIFDAVVFAEVVPTTVRCKNKEITIKAKDNAGYIELYNPVNCDIDFDWDIQEKNYSIVPTKGHIKSRKSLYCKLTFTPGTDSVFKTEIYLLSQSGAKQIIRVRNAQARTSLRFNTSTIEIKHIPLNTPVSRLLVVRNESEQCTYIFLRDPNPIEQISITPAKVNLQGKSHVFFKITAHFKTVTSFNCSVDFVFPDNRSQTVQVSGQVTFPNVIVEPELMHIPRLVTNGYHRQVFRISNNCSVTTKIIFLLENYFDFSITDLKGIKIKNAIILPPRDYTDLFLVFKPMEPTSYTFFLPYVINDLIGPPLLNNPQSFLVHTYMVPPTEDIFKPLSVLRISCAAGAPWFKFSSFILKFREENQERVFQITNISSASHKIKFDFGDIESCYIVTVDACTGTYNRFENFLKVTLEPENNLELKFRFNVEDYGVYEKSVPFYVKGQLTEGPFNYVSLYGAKYKPRMELETRTINMPSIPVNKTYLRKIKLLIQHHKPDCTINIMINHEYLKVDYKIDGENMDLSVIFSPKTECNLESKITLSCTCEAYCKFVVTAECDNCSLLSYRHKMYWWSDGTFPLVCAESCLDQFNKGSVKKSEKLNEILERYIFSQGFFLSTNYKIPSTISKYPFSMYGTQKLRAKSMKERLFHLPIVTLFKNLVGPEVLPYLTDGISYANLDERLGTAYDYSTYKNILKYLEDYHVFVKNLRPELLLSYERYVVFRNQLLDENNSTDEPILSEDIFNFHSNQCWLDLLMKTFKLFHYDRLLKNIPPSTGKMEPEDVYRKQISAYYDKSVDLFPTDISECEIKLMLWVEFHFNQQKAKLWPASEPPERKIRDLCNDLRDSLPLATLMAAYCPYLAHEFKDIYLEGGDSVSHSSIHHNACLIYEASNRLHLSFKISTETITEPINIEMLFFLSYLYLVLPGFYPMQTETIISPLGKTSSSTVKLKNHSAVGLSYAATLFSSGSDSFQLDNSLVVIPPRCEREFIFSYTAKQIIKEEAVLVLSGETGGQKYSKSMAINLIGIPDILISTQDYKLKVDLYQIEKKHIDVVSPYAQPYHATTYFNQYIKDKPPVTMDDFVSVTLLPGLPRQIELDGVCAFDEEGTHRLSLKLCFIIEGDWTYFIYFLNKEVGIFSIKVSIRAELNESMRRTVPISIKTNFDNSAPCKCKNSRMRNLQCPRILYANIPFQNTDLLEGLKNMIKIYAMPNEIDFWTPHLVFPKGFHLFRTYLENTYNDDLVPFKKVLNPGVIFNTVVDDKRFTVDSSIEFDSFADGHYQLLIHWNSSEEPYEELLDLEAFHGVERRTYTLNFLTRRSGENDHKGRKVKLLTYLGRAAGIGGFQVEFKK